jgi:hypothetical protein
MIPNSTYRPHGVTCRLIFGRHSAVTSFCVRSPYGVMPQGLYTESVVVTSKTNSMFMRRRGWLRLFRLACKELLFLDLLPDLCRRFRV